MAGFPTHLVIIVARLPPTLSFLSERNLAEAIYLLILSDGLPVAVTQKENRLTTHHATFRSGRTRAEILTMRKDNSF